MNNIKYWLARWSGRHIIQSSLSEAACPGMNAGQSQFASARMRQYLRKSGRTLWWMTPENSVQKLEGMAMRILCAMFNVSKARLLA